MKILPVVNLLYDYTDIKRKIDLLMVDLMKNATVFESNCNCFPVHPLKIKEN